MQEHYDPKNIEAAAQRFWNEHHAFEVTELSDKPKFYCLSMLPYPSGALHMGHVRNYTIGDVISRYKRMTGHNVLQPMGWDAFGLPAENAAIKHKVPPAQWTYQNIRHMKQQLQSLGYAIDWTREFATCQPDYYRWEQLFFTRLFKKGVVYRKNSVVNWDPVDETVLANEQVIEGRGWRSGALVERREIAQWFFRITDYAEELLRELDNLPGWPESVKTMQRNWIGRSEGLEIRFDVESGDSLTVYTTRPDTLMGVTFLSVAAEHPLALQAASSNPALAAFCQECKNVGVAEATIEAQEKRGMDTGMFAIHPLTKARIPIYVANFVLMAYGTGAVMAVPAHDQRDWEFARKYQLPIKQVIRPVDGSLVDLHVNAYTEKGLCIHSGIYDDMTFTQAFDALSQDLEKSGQGVRRVNYRLRDWGVSRQRYWGCPIPIIYCAKCGAIPVPENQLPVLLPENIIVDGVKSPIKSDPEWRRCICPVCGGAAERETDTFDTFMESSWYYARYTSPGAADLVDERANYWLPVDQYIGGIEHAILHLLYFRFFHKLMRDAGLVKISEPAINLLCQGMVIAETFYREAENGAKVWFNPEEVEVILDDRAKVVGAKLLHDGQPVRIGGTEKMSKSKNNGVDPQTMIDKFGADTVRLFSMFASPPEMSLEWSESGVEGMARFLRRLWREVHTHVQAGLTPPLNPEQLNQEQKAIRRKVHETIQKVSDDIGRRHTFNTAIAAVMELMNTLARFDDKLPQSRAVAQEAWESVALLMNPITPHMTHALWQALGHAETLIEDVGYPKPDPAALVRDSVLLAVQVGGKLRSTIEVAVDASKDAIEQIALADPVVSRFIASQPIKKIIVVPGKIVNIVI